MRVESTSPQERSANDGARFQVSGSPMDVDVLSIHLKNLFQSVYRDSSQNCSRISKKYIFSFLIIIYFNSKDNKYLIISIKNHYFIIYILQIFKNSVVYICILQMVIQLVPWSTVWGEFEAHYIGKWSGSGRALYNGDSIWGRDPILPDRINTNTENPHTIHPPVSLFGFSLALLECGNLYQLNNRCTQKRKRYCMKRGLIIISSSESLKAKIEIRDVDTMAGKMISRRFLKLWFLFRCFMRKIQKNASPKVMF